MKIGNCFSATTNVPEDSPKVKEKDLFSVIKQSKTKKRCLLCNRLLCSALLPVFGERVFCIHCDAIEKFEWRILCQA